MSCRAMAKRYKVRRRPRAIRETRGMRFAVEHEFAASRAEVIALACDPAFQSTLDLPDVSRAEVVEATVVASQHVLRLRYEFTGSLDPIARKLLAGRKLSWLQDLRVDAGTGAGNLSFSAESEPRRLFGRADLLFETLDGDTRTRRQIRGDLHVKVPLVGGSAEKRIVPGLVARLDVEAAALTRQLEADESR